MNKIVLDEIVERLLTLPTDKYSFEQLPDHLTETDEELPSPEEMIRLAAAHLSVSGR